MKTRSLIRLGNAALAFGIITSTVAGALLIATTPAVADATPTSSAHTASWFTSHPDETDPNYQSFKDLTVTVSQTENLTNQGITVTWSGAKGTSPAEYATNFLQIMQCWGDEADGPSPQQCEWGAPSATIGNLTGVNVSKRGLTLGDDPAEDPALIGDNADPDLLLPAPIEDPNQQAFSVPFRSVQGVLAKTPDDIAKLFDASTTNEVTAARTAADGTGRSLFQAQTSLEAPELGCGADATSADGSVRPRSCWLVVVPRGELNLDGTASDPTVNGGRITGSPLSASAWKNRLQFKLGFRSVSQSCPIGNAEERIVGAETIAEAITSWQPALCALGTTYGYSQLGDSEARRQVVSDVSGSARLAVVSTPLDKATADGATLSYAPIAQSGIVVAFTIDYRLYPTAPAYAKNGLAVENLTLNARLVAKLLTQSYRIDVPGGGGANATVAKNPKSILTDPEFLDLNPDFVGSTSDNDPEGLMVDLDSSDANAAVWAWLRADPLASEFLAGGADEWGMTMNPSYSALNLATDTSLESFPKADLTVTTGTTAGEPGYGTLDMRPYMIDMHEGALRTLEADPNNKSTWNQFKTPAAYVSLGAQVPGARFVMSLTDAASAERYGLNTAKLVNGAGQPTAATTASITRGISLMKDSDSAPGVKVVDTSKRAVGAYPLALIDYAAVNVCRADRSELAAYAKLIDYAVGAGQISGEGKGALPRGYVPLSDALTTQAKQAASDLTNKRLVAKTCGTDTPTATPTPAPTKSAAAPTPPIVPPVAPPVQTAVSTPPPVVTPEDPDTATVVHATTDNPLSGGRAGLAGALALGIPSIIAGPLLSRRGRKLASAMDLE